MIRWVTAQCKVVRKTLNPGMQSGYQQDMLAGLIHTRKKLQVARTIYTGRDRDQRICCDFAVDGEPGWRTIWRGLETHILALRGYHAVLKKIWIKMSPSTSTRRGSRRGREVLLGKQDLPKFATAPKRRANFATA